MSVFEALLTADLALHAWLVALPHPGWLNVAMIAATMAGQAGAVWWLLGTWATFRQPRHGPALFRLVLALLLTWAVVDAVLKPLAARPRPGIVADVGPPGQAHPPRTYAFPSGHAASAVAGALALGRIWPAQRAWLWAIAGLVAFSRLYLGVHYPLDVLAGAIVGWGCGLLVLGRDVGPKLSKTPRGAGAAGVV